MPKEIYHGFGVNFKTSILKAGACLARFHWMLPTSWSPLGQQLTGVGGVRVTVHVFMDRNGKELK